MINDTGLNQLVQALKEQKGRIIKDAKKAVRMGANIIRKEMRAKAPAKTRYLRKSIQIKIDGRGGQVIAKIGPSSKAYWARFIEYGASPHAIRIKRKQILSDGTNVFGREVAHPGVRPKPFIRPAFDTKVEEAKQAIADQLRQALEGG